MVGKVKPHFPAHFRASCKAQIIGASIDHQPDNYTDKTNRGISDNFSCCERAV